MKKRAIFMAGLVIIVTIGLVMSVYIWPAEAPADPAPHQGIQKGEPHPDKNSPSNGHIKPGDLGKIEGEDR